MNLCCLLISKNSIMIIDKEYNKIKNIFNNSTILFYTV